MSGRQILCCGEALIDMLPRPVEGGATGYVPFCGGAVFNTAIALGRLGRKVGLLTGLSQDMFGEMLADALRESGVSTGLAIRSDRPTTLAFVRLRNGQASYSFYDDGSAGRMIATTDLPELPGDLGALYFGGISLACEPGADTYAHLLDRADRRLAVMLDPNIRPGFIRDAETYRARLRRMMERADIVKLSDEDLEWLMPGDEPVEDKIARLRALGPSIAILTRGGQGAWAWMRDGTKVEVAARRVAVVDTVGAGDTFNAGVLAALDATGSLTPERLAQITAPELVTALEYGARVAAVTVSRAGANPPWTGEIPED